MRKNQNKLLIGIIVFFLIVCLAACGYLVFKHLSSNSDAEKYKELVETTAQDTTAQPTSLSEEDAIEFTQPSDTNEIGVNLKSLIAENSEIYAWIHIPDTNVNYPVAQSFVDDNFYLDHNIYKEYSFPGTIYSQSCNSKDYSDRVTVLYGHNMLNGSMFANLLQYSDKDFFDKNPYIYIYTVDRKLTYEIVSAFLYDDRHIMNSFDFTDDSVFQSWLDQAQNPRSTNSNARDSVELDLDSKILVLSTCPDYGSGRYLVQGVLISDEKI